MTTPSRFDDDPSRDDIGPVRPSGAGDGRRRGASGTAVDDADDPDDLVGIVIPAWNEADRIGRTIDALRSALAAAGRPGDIVVADDASDDDTAEIARRHGARVVPLARRQIAAARNAGASAVRGSTLVFVDADTLVPPATLAAALAVLGGPPPGRRGRPVVAGGAEVRFDAPVPLYAQLLLWAVMTGLRRLRMGAGCFLFCTREAFDAAGGFDERLFASEELAFSRAVKRCGRFVVLREPVVTSARKIERFPARTILATGFGMLLSGFRTARRREAMGVWYGPRARG